MVHCNINSALRYPPRIFRHLNERWTATPGIRLICANALYRTGSGRAAPHVADVTTPTLEDLRDVPEAAWLWDGARARIVWANSAGHRLFRRRLAVRPDRPAVRFPRAGCGADRQSFARSLRRGQVETALLHFPSSGALTPLACRCMIHALADGRPGVLVVARQSAAAAAQKANDDILTAFDLLPSAAVLIGAGRQDPPSQCGGPAAAGGRPARQPCAACWATAAEAEDLIARVDGGGHRRQRCGRLPSGLASAISASPPSACNRRIRRQCLRHDPAR